MTKLTVYKKDGTKQGAVTVDDAIFAVKPKASIISEVVRAHNANSRDAIAHTKDRRDVSGGGRKPWRQKGTGRARAGSNRSPIWRGGGVTFGPRSNRNFSLGINKKVKALARSMALSQKAADNNIYTVEGLEALKRADAISFLDKLKLEGKKILLISSDKAANIVRDTRNMAGITNIGSNSINAYDVLNADAIIWSKATLASIGKKEK